MIVNPVKKLAFLRKSCILLIKVNNNDYGELHYFKESHDKTRTGGKFRMSFPSILGLGHGP